MGGVRRHRPRADARWPTTRRCSCSPARPSAASARTPTRRACSSPTRNLVGRWATYDEFRRLEALGLTMYGQMTAGSWIYIGSQGIVQGTFETFVAARKAHEARSAAARRPLGAHRRARRHGRRAAARRDDGGALLPRRRDRSDAHRQAARDPLRRRAHRRSRQGARRRPRLGRRGPPALVRDVRQRRRRVPGAGAPRRHARPRHRADRRARSAHRLRPPGITLNEAASLRERDPEGLHRVRQARHARRGRGHAGDGEARGRGVRLRQQPPHLRQGGGLRARLRHPRLRPRLRARALLPGQGPVPLGGALRRPGRHPRHRSRRARGRAARRRPAPLDRARPAAHRLPGPAGAHLLAGLRRPRQGRPRLQRAGAPGEGEGAHRDRPRPPRLRLGRLAVPRDRGDARTAPTPSPTGPSSTRSPTAPAGPPG